MKKIILTESDITKIVKKSIERKLNEDKFYVEPDVPRQPREKDIDGIFGKYSYHVPDDVIRYMRKNPSLIIKRLVDIYGEDKVRQYIDGTVIPNEMDKTLYNPSLMDELGEGSADTNDDGEISKKELHKHFDLNDDGKVTPQEYDDHIQYHVKKVTNEIKKRISKLS
jgi:hypothetical protein